MMKRSDLFLAAVTGLFQHKLRTLLTLLGVTLGTLLLFSSLAGGLGVLNAVNNRLSVGNRLLEIKAFSGWKTTEVTVEEAREAGFVQDMNDQRRIRLARAAGVGGRERVPMTLSQVEVLREIKHVDQVWANFSFSGSARISGSNSWAVATVESLPPQGHDFSSLIVAGSAKATHSANQILVSELLMFQLGIRTDTELRDVVGKTIDLTLRERKLEQLSAVVSEIAAGRLESESLSIEKAQQELDLAVEQLAHPMKSFTIAGVYRQPTDEEIVENPSLVRAMTRMFLMPHESAVNCWNEFGLADSALKVVVLSDQPEHVKQIETAITALGFRTQSFSAVALQIQTAVLLITALITAIAGGALLISAIGITNTMIMNVMERRKDIAIMKAIGARDRDVSRMFLWEGMLVGLSGGIGGLVLGLVVARGCGDHIRHLLEQRLEGDFHGAIFAYPLWLIIGTPVLAALVTTIATYIPARRAARVDPAATLRGL